MASQTCYTCADTHTQMTCSVCAVMACYNVPETWNHQHPHTQSIWWHLNSHFYPVYSISVFHDTSIQSVCLKYEWKYLLFSSTKEICRVTSSLITCWCYLFCSYIQDNRSVRKYFRWTHKAWMCLLDNKQAHILYTRQNKTLTSLRVFFKSHSDDWENR